MLSVMNLQLTVCFLETPSSCWLWTKVFIKENPKKNQEFQFSKFPKKGGSEFSHKKGGVAKLGVGLFQKGDMGN